MASYIPTQGKVLDLGCGHGLLAFALALGSPGRNVLALDHDTARIDLAKSSHGELPGLRFEIGDFGILEKTKQNLESFVGITLIDVMHYFPFADQDRYFKQAFEALSPGGVLLFREVNPEAGLTSAINQFHEVVMTRIGFTQAQELHFRSIQEWAQAAQNAGFEVTSQPCGHFPFADVLFICKKPGTA